jgi:heptaprenylglyceryl phosphate synthase
VVGGGITTPAHAQKIYNAGADVVVIGNVFEKKPELMQAFAAILR